MQQPDSRQPQVLIVEDDDDTRVIYSTVLRHAGFGVLEAADGMSAVDCTVRNHPDLVLMDLDLPSLDGWEAARLIKADPRAACIPLIAFSAMIDSIADLRRGASPFDGFVAKPVSARELVRRVTAYLGLLCSQPTGRHRLPDARPEVKSAHVAA